MAATMSAAAIAPASLGSKAEALKATRGLSAAPQMVCLPAKAVTVCAQQQSEASVQNRRSMLSLLAATVAAGAFASEAQAEAIKIRVEGPPPPIGGLPGTDSSDQARDTDAPLKERFFIQALSPDEAAARAKVSADEIISVKSYIDKKAWPYVQNDLRTRAYYLRYDLNTVINSKTKEEKKSLTALANELYDSITALDYAAKVKSVEKANSAYDETVKLLNDVLAKIA